MPDDIVHPHSTAIVKKSRFAALPGSIHATRVQYGRTQQSFEPADIYMTESKINQRSDTLKFKQPARLGNKAEWNNSTACHAFPQRPMMRTLSEFQSTKPVMNYRAEELPKTFKDTVFLPKPSKFQVDRKRFLTEDEKKKLVGSNPVLNSRSEFDISSKLNGGAKPGWNTSTLVTEDYTREFFKSKQYSDMRSLTAVKNSTILANSGYINPTQREKIRMQRIRQMKMEQREREEAQQAGLDGEFSGPRGHAFGPPAAFGSDFRTHGSESSPATFPTSTSSASTINVPQKDARGRVPSNSTVRTADSSVAAMQ
eukprot:TRINITY_DN39196_c0_g1_i1.p1 TRINITY_DN39196_c0_g1~~TRINITY_DN39196_c0_g1_i1.p1  ORF type:complete len:322 (-),score=31.29 TRINITY_DN39196_c0_g1_i1:82-1017(-)